MVEGDKRVDIKVGFSCNNNCRFCVQAHNLWRGNKTTEEIKKDLGNLKAGNYSLRIEISYKNNIISEMQREIMI